MNPLFLSLMERVAHFNSNAIFSGIHNRLIFIYQYMTMFRGNNILQSMAKA